jgi:DNA-binding NarL/FixJ family response regulator
MEAENGQNLLDKLESAEAPDICLLDINMPQMNGFETIVHLKKNWPNMRVLFLSMHNDRAYLKKSMELGADGFLAKDAPVDQLKSMLMSLTATAAVA